MQQVDYTTLTAASTELRADWLPARLEQVYQRDRYTIAIGLRTLNRRGWLDISWHPQAARLCVADSPPRHPDTFTFSQQLRHQLGGLALVAIAAISPWERVLDFQFAQRPGDVTLWHLYVEIMGKYSNVILTTADDVIVTAAHQVTAQQSSVRPILTGQPYQMPPALTDAIPSLSEPQERWQERIGLIPGPLRRNLLKNYRGLSSALVILLVEAAGLDPEQSTDSLTLADWRQLFGRWQEWLQALEQGNFQPSLRGEGYTVMGGFAATAIQDKADDAAFSENTHTPISTASNSVLNLELNSVHTLLNNYYTRQLNHQEFTQLRHQLTQKIHSLLSKLYAKAATFQTRLQQSEQSDLYRSYADLLMANLHQWQPGMKAITLADFETGHPITISLDLEKNAIQNAQALYKQHQKLKRARIAVEPLLASVQEEINYLEQIEAALSQLQAYQTADDLQTLEEIREELIQQQYMEAPEYRRPTPTPTTEFHRYQTPSGFEVLVGRNNRQNDQLTFRVAGDYDLWFHTQEIPGSHVLLRLSAGTAPDDQDLQWVADLSAFYSRAYQSEQVPVIYTKPKYVYKPKGAKPGMVVYKHEQVVWGKPQQGAAHTTNAAKNLT